MERIAMYLTPSSNKPATKKLYEEEKKRRRKWE